MNNASRSKSRENSTLSELYAIIVPTIAPYVVNRMILLMTTIYNNMVFFVIIEERSCCIKTFYTN